MKIYVIEVLVKYDNSTYIDSIWENYEDAVEHIKYCHKICIFDTNFEPHIIEKELYKHI